MIESIWTLTKGLCYLAILVGSVSLIAGLMFGVAKYAFKFGAGI